MNRRPIVPFASHNRLVLAIGLLAACQPAADPPPSDAPPPSPAAPVVSPIPASAWAKACTDYAAMCPSDPEPKCKQRCPELRFPERHQMCAFIYCAAEVERCDNAEDGDATIRACMVDRGWDRPG